MDVVLMVRSDLFRAATLSKPWRWSKA